MLLQRGLDKVEFNMKRYCRIHIFAASILLFGLSGCGGGGGDSCGGAAALVGLAGCAGGGGSSSSSSSSAPAVVESVVQGVYQGTTSNGKTEDAIVLEDGTFWDIWGVPSGTALAVQGVATGSSTASNGAFTLSFNDFPAPGNSPISGQGSGTYSGSNLIGTFTENGATATFNFIAPVQVTYDYNAAANISSILGSWSGGLLTGETATISILAGGTISGTSSLGCSFTGTAAPRPSGKNVFNVSLTFGGSPCVAANQVVSGIGVTYPLGNGTNQLVTGLVNSSQSLATAFFAQR